MRLLAAVGWSPGQTVRVGLPMVGCPAVGGYPPSPLEGKTWSKSFYSSDLSGKVSPVFRCKVFHSNGLRVKVPPCCLVFALDGGRTARGSGGFKGYFQFSPLVEGTLPRGLGRIANGGAGFLGFERRWGLTCGFWVVFGGVGEIIFLTDGRGSVGGGGVVLPEVLEGFGEGLSFDCVVYVAGVASEHELVRIVLGGEDAGHVFVGDDPVVHVVAHDVGVVEVAVSYFKPETERLARRVGDQGLMEAPGALRSFGVPGPLLIDVGSGVGEDAVVEVGVVPGHDEGAGAPGAAAHGGAGVGIVAEFDVGLDFDEGEDFVLDEFGVVGREGVVLETALGALRVSSAVLDGYGDHDGDFVLGDEVVEDSEEERIGTVGSYDEGGDGAGDVLRGDVDGDLASVGRGVAGGDVELGGIRGVGRTEGSRVSGDSRVVFAVRRGHGDGDKLALWDVGIDGGLRRRGMSGAEDVVPVGHRRG